MKEERVHLTLTLQIWLVLIHIIGLKKNSISISLIIENLSSFFSGLRGVYKGRQKVRECSPFFRLRKETCARSDCHLHFLEQTFVYVCVSEVKVVSDVESGAGSLVTPFKNEEINIKSFFFFFFFLKEVRPLPTEKQ